MPRSSKEGKDEIVSWCKELPDINTIVDIGAGSGTYYKMLVRKNKMFLASMWIAIEAWQNYITQYELDKKYNKVINQDARTVQFSTIGDIDLTIMGDMLEHMTKDEAISLVNEISKNSRYAIISIPIVHYPQDEFEGNPFEVHIKDDWSHSEVMETFPNIVKTFEGTEIGCYLLKFK